MGIAEKDYCRAVLFVTDNYLCSMYNTGRYIYINNGWWVYLKHTSIYITFAMFIFIIYHMIFCHRDIKWFSILCLCMFFAGITVLPDFHNARELGQLTPCKSSDKRVWLAHSIMSLYYTGHLCDKCWQWNSYNECRGWIYRSNGGDHKYWGWNHPNLIPLLSPLDLGNLRTCDEASTSISASEAFTTPDYSILEIYMGGRWRYYKMKGEEITEISESSMKHQFWINGADKVNKGPF
jgi:hypothetical protein